MNIYPLYRAFAKYFRTKRMRRFRQVFAPSPDCRILDVGGDAFNWQLLGLHSNITFLNPDIRNASGDSSAWLKGDGRCLPFKDGAFDIVYSNSVIEHLGDFESQRLFASECRRVGKRYYVQTPDRHFFVEPHLITPFVHWLPRRIQRSLLRNFTLWGCMTRPTAEDCDRFMSEIRLLGKAEMRYLFPDAEIEPERFLGMSKSLIAVKSTEGTENP